MTQNAPQDVQEQEITDPVLRKSEVDGLITDRIMQFHEALVDRGQISPIVPEAAYGTSDQAA